MNERNEKLRQALVDAGTEHSSFGRLGILSRIAGELADNPEMARAWRDALNEHVEDEAPAPQPAKLDPSAICSCGWQQDGIPYPICPRCGVSMPIVPPQPTDPTAEIITLLREIDAARRAFPARGAVARRHELQAELRKVMDNAPAGIEIAGTIELSNGATRPALMQSYSDTGPITAWSITYRTPGTITRPGRWRAVTSSTQRATFRVSD